jgi:hypothetical protein
MKHELLAGKKMDIVRLEMVTVGTVFGKADI